MTLYKEYWKLPEGAATDLKEGTEIKAYISYNKTPSSWIGGCAPKGYRVCVVPVKRSSLEGGFSIEESGAFTGFNDTLLECERQSAKKINQAIQILQERKDKYLSKFIKVTEKI